ncbi:MAG TPA: hypothetical protein DHU65_01195 [Clostridiales bacterium]|nr:hypothetical protein [Clostridiales bacterium]
MKLINKIKLIVLFAVMLVASLCIAACSGNDSDSVKIPDYPSKIEKQHNTYTDLQDGTVVTIDGTITEAEWEKQNKWEETIPISGYDHHIEIWSRFTEEGVVMAYRVTGAPAYYDAGRGNYANSGIEIYIANGKATTAAGNQWEMEFFANGAYHTSKYIKFNGHDGYAGSNAYVDVAGRWLDKNGNTTYVNNPENNGYEDEVMIPWYVLGGKCDSIVFNAAIQYMASATSTSRSGYINMLGVLEGDYYWTACQSWRRFDKDGYYDKSKGEFAITPYDVGVKAYNDGYAFTEHGWNNGSSQLYNNTPVAAGEDYILTAKLYAPHLAHEEGSEGWNKNYANETNYLPQGQGGTETAYNGLSATRNGYKIELAFQKGWGSDGVFFRWNGNDFGWTSIKLSSAQLEKYMTVGLNVGMYVKGNVVTPLLENDAGELVMLDGGMVKTIDKWATAGETKLGFYYQCDAKFDQWKVYAGESINGSLTVIDETESGAHGSVTAVGKMYDTVTINVTPEEGYELASLLVDGVEYAARVENNVVTAKVTGTKVTVKATFRTAINQTITLNVTRKFAYEAKAYSADGSEIILTDAEGNTYTGLVTNGQVTVKIVDGTYTLTAKGCANATPVTVENGQASITDVVLLRKLFNDVDETVTAVLTGDGTSETGATLQTTVKENKNVGLDNNQWKIENNVDFSGKTVLIYTLGMGSERQCYATIGTNRHLYAINQGHWNDKTGYYDAPNNKWTVNVKHSEPTTFMAIFEGRAIQLYYKVNGVWTLLADYEDQGEGELTSIIFTQGEHSAIITWSDIKVYDGARADEILKNTAALGYDQAVVNATISKTAGIEKGEEVTVTAAVKDSATHQIASVTVNGTALTAGEDGTYKFTATGYMGTYNVVVTAETLATELTFTTTHKFAYEKAYYNLPDGTELSFVSGSIVKNAIVANGKVTISLSDGTYTVNGLTVVVNGGAVESTSLEFTRAIVKTSDNATVNYNETGLSYTTSGESSVTIADIDMTNNVMVFDIRAQYDGNSSWSDLFVEPYNNDGNVDSAHTIPNNSSVINGVGYRIDWLPNQNGSQFQLGGNKNGDHAVRTTKNWTTVLLRTVITDGNAKTDVYIGNIDGTYSLFGYLGKNNVDVSAMDYKFRHSGDNEVKNVKVYDGERATAYFDGLTKVEASNATVDGVTLTGSRYADLTKYESEKSIVVYPIASNQAGCNNFSISSEEKIVAMTYNMQILDKTFVGTKDADGAWMTFDKTDGAEIVHQMKDYLGYRFRYDWGTQPFADNYKTAVYENGGAKFALYLAGNTGNYLTVGADGVMYNSKSVTYTDANNVPTAITGIRSAVAIKLTDVKFYTQAQWNEYVTETANANIEVTADENGTAVVDYHLGGNTTVTVAPAEGYVLETLKVNGEDVTAKISESVYTAEKYGKLGIKVEATFKLKPAEKYNVTLNVTVHNTAKTASALTGEATLTGANGTYKATAANGKLEFKDVVKGEYKLQVEGYTETTIVVDKAVNSELELYFVTSGATTVKNEANDAVYTLNNNGDKITLPANAKAVSFRIKVVNYTVASNADNCGLHVNTNVPSNEAGNAPELWLKDGTFKARICWAANAPFSNYQLAKLTGDGLLLVLEIKDGKIWYYAESYDGNLILMANKVPEKNTVPTNFTDITLRDITGGVIVSELTVSDTVDNGRVVVETTAEATMASDKTALKNGETATVTVTPKEGYKVAGVKVNGEYVAATVNEAGVATVTIKGQYGVIYYVSAVVTAVAEGTAKTYTVAHGYAYETPYALADGTLVTFVSEAGTYQGIVNGGKLTVTAPAGTYTAVLANHTSLSVEITEAAEEGSLTFIRTIIKDTSATDLTALDNGKDGATVSNKNNQLGNPPKSYIQIGDNISGKTVYTMTLKVPSLGWGSCPRLWFFDEADSYSYSEIENIVNVVISGSIEFNPQNSNTAKVASTSVDILVIVEGTKVNVYVKASSAAEYVHVNAKGGATDYTLNLPSNVKFMAIGATDGFKTWDMANIKAYDGERVENVLAITASVAADSSEQAEVVLSKTTAIAKGEEVTATVTLKDSENYQIVSVSVNGTVLTGEAGVYKFNADSYATNYVVKVVTEATAHEVAATAQYKYAYESDLYNMADGTELTFTSGSIQKTATVKDGKLTIALSNGEYTVSGDRIQSFALVVTDEITTAKLEAKRLTLVATDESKMTITEDENGATVTFNGKTFKSAYALLPTISGKTVIKGTYVGAGSWDDSLDFLNADKTQNDYLLNIGSWGEEGNYTVDLKWLNASDTTTGTANKESGVFQVKFAIVIDGNSITGYSSVLKADGTWEEYKTKTGLTAKTLLFGFASGGTGACSFKNVTIAALTGDFNPND